MRDIETPSWMTHAVLIRTLLVVIEYLMVYGVQISSPALDYFPSIIHLHYVTMRLC